MFGNYRKKRQNIQVFPPDDCYIIIGNGSIDSHYRWVVWGGGHGNPMVISSISTEREKGTCLFGDLPADSETNCMRY